MLEQDREAIEPLAIGLLVAVLLHVIALPAMTLLRRDPVLRGLADVRDMPEVDWIQPAEPEIELGRDDAPKRSTVAWIPYDAFEDLIAPKAKTLQPVLQTKVDPVPDAEVAVDPTPPAPRPQPRREPQVASAAAPPQPVQRHSQAAPAPPIEVRKQPDADMVVPPPAEKVEVESIAPPPPQMQQQPQPPAPPTSDANPTVAPRAEAEADPTTLDQQVFKVKPGRVLTSTGIEITTAIPDIGAVTLSSVLPRNPKAKIEFGPDGKVTRAVLIRSTGHAGYDAPIEASLYRWRAKGKRLEELNRSFVIYVDLLLGP